MCGFLGHNAHRGCSLCYKRFQGSVGEINLSGFDRENWLPMTGSRHACSLVGLYTKSDLKKTKSELGCRYSVLLTLHYFDAPRMLIVDPMHNILLGSAKYFLKSILVSHNVISEGDFAVIQNHVTLIVAASNIRCIPHKTSSGCSSFTADQ